MSSITLSQQQIQAEMQPFYASGDRLIGHYVVGHALLALVLAGVYDTWLVTLVAGSAMAAMFFIVAWSFPRSFLTRSVGGIVLQGFVALHTYQMHGLPEARFFFFTAITVMVMYQDWACLWPGFLLAAGQRLLLLFLYSHGIHTYLLGPENFPPAKMLFHLSIALVHLSVCSYWAHTLRQRTLQQAAQREELQISREFIARQLQRDRASELALQASERRYRWLADVMPQLVWTLNTQGRLTYANKRLIEYLGFPLEDLMERNLIDLIHPEDHHRVIAAWKTAVEMGDIYEIEHRIRDSRTGLYGWFLGRGMPLRDADGRVNMWLGTSTDITAKKQVEEELVHSNEDLRQFAYAASHDLQEPLRNISTFTELLARRYRGKFDAEADEYIQYCLGAARRMQTMVSGLLDFSRIGSIDKAELSAVPAAHALATSLANLQTLIRESSATVTSGNLPRVLSDPSQLVRVFQNLISNAIKYRADEAPRIHVSAKRTVNEWVISVHDNGQGFRPEYAERIFGLFKRLHNQDIPGTGIGLALSKRIVERQGGRIWAESNLGKGSIFHFSLEAAPELPSIAAAPEPVKTVQRISMTFSSGSAANLPPVDAATSNLK